MQVSMPIEILWAMLNFIGDYNLLSNLFPNPDSVGKCKVISDNEMSVIEAKKQKLFGYMNVIIKEYVQSIIDYKQTNTPQNYLTVSKITEIINNIKQL
jgi:hypothetical protein